MKMLTNVMSTQIHDTENAFRLAITSDGLSRCPFQEISQLQFRKNSGKSSTRQILRKRALQSSHYRDKSSAAERHSEKLNEEQFVWLIETERVRLIRVPGYP